MEWNMINRYFRWIFPLEKRGYVNAFLIVENISNAFVVTHRQLSHLRDLDSIRLAHPESSKVVGSPT